MTQKKKTLLYSNHLHMTDQAGPRHCEYHPGTKFWHPPIEVTQFWQPRSGFGARSRFERQKKQYETKQ